MRYKHITTVGTLLISFFVFLAAVAYYFNEGVCPKDTFVCPNSTICIEQGRWCDSKNDCLAGEDEASESCFDKYGSLAGLQSRTDKLTEFRDNGPNFSCPILNENPEDDEECQYIRDNRSYKGCKIKCTDFEGDISETLPENMIKFIISNSSIEILKKGYFDHYPEIRSLSVTNSYNLKILESNVFENQHELIELYLQNNSIEEITVSHLVGLKKLDFLDLNMNKIHTLNLQDLQSSQELVSVHAQKNMLTSSRVLLPYLPVLKDLSLDDNKLGNISTNIFENLPALESLGLERNEIQYISPKAFQNQKNLIDLNLMYNRIKILDPKTFQFLEHLQSLKIGYNLKMKLSEGKSLLPLKNSLKIIGTEGIDLPELHLNFFNDFTNLTIVYFKRFHYCTAYAPKVKFCTPPMDGVSSFVYLLGTPMVRSAVWGISCLTCLGNALVLWGRFTARDENRVLSIIIRNLAVSDLLMGIYLFIVGLEDMRFENNYKDEDSSWRSSWSCTFLGMLAMISSEVSVLILMFMSMDRFMLISAPLKKHHTITPRFATSSMTTVWLIGLSLALFPVINWRNSFYGQNGMCFPLHIDDPYHLGWEYSAFIVLGINLLGLLTIGFTYCGMFISIWRTRHATSLSTTDSEFVLRFFMIVLTDCVCWTPIIVLKILALNNYTVDTQLHSWIVVFILPINSAVNPILYTFTTPKFRDRLKEWWNGTMRKVASRKESRDSITSNTCAHTIDKDIVISPTYSSRMPDIFFELYPTKENN